MRLPVHIRRGMGVSSLTPGSKAARGDETGKACSAFHYPSLTPRPRQKKCVNERDEEGGSVRVPRLCFCARSVGLGLGEDRPFHCHTSLRMGPASPGIYNLSTRWVHPGAIFSILLFFFRGGYISSILTTLIVWCLGVYLCSTQCNEITFPPLLF
jgi:hypothetical protein